MAHRNFSIVHWFPELEKHKCGYCKQLNTNCSYGMWAQCMSVEDYQNLIDRGWRRSGKYLYKPVMDMTCCPLYTIRCEAVNFKVTKSQKKIIKRVNRFWSESCEEDAVKNREDFDNDMEMHSEEEIVANTTLNDKPVTKIDIKKVNMEKLDCTMNIKIENTELNRQSANNLNNFSKKVEDKTSRYSLPGATSKDIKAGEGADPTKPPCKKAKFLRLERKQQKLAAKGISLPIHSNTSTFQGKTLEEFINDIFKSPAHKLKVCLVLTSGTNRDWSVIRAQEYPAYRKYQMIIHNDSPDKCSEKQFTRFLLESPLEIVLKHMTTSESSYLESAGLYAKYQMFVHNDPAHECDLSTFEEFLVDTPLEHWNPPDGPAQGYGSFHQQYWLDDMLIAVGVIDILPKCISSVYFFYDPDFRHLTLGTYGSLYELYFTRQLQNTVPNIQYYYMGFYIHTCPKMRYKANLNPSFLLCPETYGWFPVEQCIPKLDKDKYCRLNEDIDALDENECTQADVDKLVILLGYESCVHFKHFKSKIPGQEEEYIKFAKLVGKTSLASILVVSRNNDF